MAEDWCPENDGAYRAEMAALHRDSVDQQLIRARAEIERLRAALETFADADKYYDPSFDDDYSPRWAEFFTIGDFRRARAALAQKGAEHD